MSLPTPRKDFGVVAFDLDGTLAEPMWPAPEIGQPIPEAIEAVAHYVSEGFAIIVHTARPASHEAAIGAWCRQHGIPVYDVVCGKPTADLYIDDRAFHPAWAKAAPATQLQKTVEAIRARNEKLEAEVREDRPETYDDPQEWTVMG